MIPSSQQSQVFLFAPPHWEPPARAIGLPAARGQDQSGARLGDDDRDGDDALDLDALYVDIGGEG